MLGHIQDGVDYLKVAKADVAALHWQAVRNLDELLGRDLHARSLPALSSEHQ